MPVTKTGLPKIGRKTKSTCIKERWEQFDQTQKIVCYRLGITPMAYMETMLASMKRYLTLRPGFAEYPGIQEAIATNLMFLNWWKNQWLSRELQFVNSIERGDKKHLLTENWLWLHNPRVLAGNIHPNSVVLEKAWPSLIGNIMEKEVQI